MKRLLMLVTVFMIGELSSVELRPRSGRITPHSISTAECRTLCNTVDITELRRLIEQTATLYQSLYEHIRNQTTLHQEQEGLDLLDAESLLEILINCTECFINHCPHEQFTPIVREHELI